MISVEYILRMLANNLLPKEEERESLATFEMGFYTIQHSFEYLKIHFKLTEISMWQNIYREHLIGNDVRT